MPIQEMCGGYSSENLMLGKNWEIELEEEFMRKYVWVYCHDMRVKHVRKLKQGHCPQK